MYNFFKNIFGIPSDDGFRHRSEDEFRNDFRNPIWGSDDYSDDDYEDFRNGRGLHGTLSFPVLTDPIEMHKFFEQQMDEMLKRFGMFGWGEQDNIGSFFNRIEDHEHNSNSSLPEASLRNSFLKPGFEKNSNLKNKQDSDLDGKVDAKDLQSLFDKNTNLVTEHPPPSSGPSMYSKSVFIRTIRRPDGSVETIRKVRDHTGHEETIVSEDRSRVIADPQPLALYPGPESQPDKDIPGLGLFKKFFPF